MPPPYAALRIDHRGRFGNAVLRYCNSVLIAREMSIPVAIWPASTLVAPSRKASNPALLRDTENPHPPERVFLDTVGKSFLHDRAFALGEPQGAWRELVNRIRTPDAVNSVFDTHIRPSIKAKCFASAVTIGPDDLVLHFRAGDIFSRADGSHPSYGQPSLSYYLFALEGHLRDHPASTVHMVFEDRGNPVIDAFEQHCRSRGIAVVAHSSDLISDVSVILAAKHLVLGTGTFGPVLALLCRECPRTVWIQRNCVPFISAALIHRGAKIIKVDIRHPKRYIDPHGWKNTPEQRRLMLDFPLNEYAVDRWFPASRPWWLRLLSLRRTGGGAWQASAS